MCRGFSLMDSPPPAAIRGVIPQFTYGLARLFTQSDRRWIYARADGYAVR